MDLEVWVPEDRLRAVVMILHMAEEAVVTGTEAILLRTTVHPDLDLVTEPLDQGERLCLHRRPLRLKDTVDQHTTSTVVRRTDSEDTDSTIRETTVRVDRAMGTTTEVGMTGIISQWVKPDTVSRVHLDHLVRRVVEMSTDKVRIDGNGVRIVSFCPLLLHREPE